MNKTAMLMLLFASQGIFAQRNEICLEVTIDNRKSDTLYLGQNDFKQVYTINGNGGFSGKFTGPPGKYYLVNGEDYIDIYLEKGFDISIAADGKDFKKSLSFQGKGAKENVLFTRQDANSLATETDITDGIEDLEAFTKGSEARLKGFRSELKDKSFTAGFRKFMDVELGHDEHNFPTMSQYQFKRQNLNGRPLPAFRYQNAKGGITGNEALKGKYAMIDVWATWCRPCHQEMPYFDQLELKYRDKNIVFLGISIDRMEDFEKWEKMVSSKEMAGVQLICDKEFESDFMNALAVNFVPRFIIVDPQGIIIDADAKKPSDPKLLEQLDKLLN